ncbi:MAG: hypothetical protein D6815_04830 [Candidatus Dadabacteria bacterium]|nr:MAG: hypothetical protein D6815_04830 [Candidatus Dadabacteria bacterium]
MKTRQSKFAGRLFAFLVAAVLGIVWAAPSAQAIPYFARRENMACSNCHTAWPMLNAFGRRYKENGYQVMRGQPSEHQDISKKLSLPKSIPLALVINSRPYDKKKNGPAKLRALHEIEILAGGNFMGWGSFFGELAAEDEGGFSVGLEHLVGGLHFNQYLNVVAGKSGPFFADPYNILQGRRITRAKSRLFNQRYGMTGVKLGATEQNVEVYGRAGGLFYSVGLGADRNDPEGEGADDYSARIAYDVMKKELTVGAFLLDGSEKSGLDKYDFRRWGIDIQGQCGMLNYQGAYMNISDELPSEVNSDLSDNNNLFLGELFLTWQDESFDNLPVPLTQIVPFVRVEKYEMNDGEDDFADLILNLTAYWTENFSSSFEYFQTLDGPDDRRFTLYFIFGV